MNHFAMLPDFRAMYPGSRIFTVPAGQTMNLPTGDYDLLWIEGTCVIPRTGDYTLSVREIVVAPTGFLDGGTPAPNAWDSPTDIVTGNVEIAFTDGPLNSADPSQWGKGLLVFGECTLYGKPKTPYVPLTASPMTADNFLSLVPPADWEVGDTIAICRTNTASPLMYELRQITAKGPASIDLDSPLTQDYPPSVIDPSNKGYVVNLTRNITFRSANPAGVRGHMQYLDRAKVDLRYVAAVDMGRTTIADLDSTTFNPDGSVLHLGTNQIGRYSLFHAHHLWGPVGGLAPDATVDWPGITTPPQYRLVGCSDLRSSKWGIAIHGTHYGLVRGNVTIGAAGAGIVTEDGSESHNVIAENFSCAMLGDGHPDRYDKEFRAGECYEFRGNHNYHIDNIAAGGTVGVGFYIANDIDNSASANMQVRVPLAPGADLDNPAEYELRSINSLPLLGWEGNEIYASVKFGLGLWNIQALPTAPVFGETLIWNCDHTSLFLDYASATFENLTIRGGQFGIRGHNINATNEQYPFWVKGFDIQGVTQPLGEDDRPGLNMVFENGHWDGTEHLTVSSLKQGYRPRSYQFKNCTHGSQGVKLALDPVWKDGSWSVASIFNKISVLFVNYQGQAGNDFRLWFPEQAPDYILTDQATGPVPEPYHTGELVTKTISPELGQTNLHNWNTYGVAPLMELAPAGTTTLPGLIGLVDGDVTPPEQPTANISADPLTIEEGQSSTLTWTTTNADTVTLNGATVATNGTQSVSPTQTTTYTLTATGPGGQVTVSVTVTVNPADDCPAQLAAANAKIADYEQRFAAIKSQIPEGI